MPASVTVGTVNKVNASNVIFRCRALFSHTDRNESTRKRSITGILYPDTGSSQTMDSYEGNTQDPASLHKYLFGADDAVNNIDPSGQFSEGIAGLLANLDISGIFAQAGFPTTPTGVLAAGNTCGPNVTAAVFATAKDVDNTWFAAGRARAAAAAMEAYSLSPDGGNRWWDVQKLNDVGQGDPRIDFGNGSSLGTGLIGKQTVQFSYSRPGVYYAGSVNYFLWGKIFSLAYHTLVHPLTGAHDPAFSESAAVAFVKAHKWDINSRGTDYENQAIAFTKFGFSGTDPSSTALPLD